PDVARYQTTSSRPWTHSVASVVLPYPAGAVTRMVCAVLASSMRVRRGSRAWRRKRGGYDSRSASIAAAAPRRRFTRLARFAARFQAGEDRRPRRAAGVGPLSPEWSVGLAGVVAQARCRRDGVARGVCWRRAEVGQG